MQDCHKLSICKNIISVKLNKTRYACKRIKEKVVYIYNGILFSLKKGDPVTCYNMDETGGHYAK